MFSRRSAWVTEASPLALAIADARRRGAPLLDLTIANPSAVGLRHPPELYAALGDPDDAAYEPLAFGLPAAREAVANHYRGRGVALDVASICLSASTSEAYAHLLALLADPGDALLVPSPSYPLLRYLADLADLELVPYRLAFDGAWHVDLGDLRAQLDATPRARAIVAIAPNNPTGNYLSDHEIAALDELAAARRLALIVDEVFHEFPVDDRPHRGPLEGPRGALTFTLGGLSKLAALPQLKLAWTITSGPPTLMHPALERLEVIADTFLSVGTPVQRALPRLLAAAPAIQATIRRRLRANLATLARAVEGTAITLLPVEGGWTALLRLPLLADLDDRGWAHHLLESADLICQPGYLYDLDGAYLALSLLTPPEALAVGIDRLVAAVERVLASGP